jgi:hypothetical protein
MINETVYTALPRPRLTPGGFMSIVATRTTLNGIEQKERFSRRGSNMYRLAWEARNAELKAQNAAHQFVELMPVRRMRNGPFLARVEQEAIELVKASRIDDARESFTKVCRAAPLARAQVRSAPRARWRAIRSLTRALMSIDPRAHAPWLQLFAGFALNETRDVIEGCTEVSVALTADEIERAHGIDVIDSSLILARAQFERTVEEIRKRANDYSVDDD